MFLIELQPTCLKQDVVTRWNSTHDKLERFAELAPELERATELYEANDPDKIAIHTAIKLKTQLSLIRAVLDIPRVASNFFEHQLGNLSEAVDVMQTVQKDLKVAWSC